MLLPHYMHAHTLYALPDNYGVNACCNNSICKPTFAWRNRTVSTKRVYGVTGKDMNVSSYGEVWFIKEGCKLFPSPSPPPFFLGLHFISAPFRGVYFSSVVSAEWGVFVESGFPKQRGESCVSPRTREDFRYRRWVFTEHPTLSDLIAYPHPETSVMSRERIFVIQAGMSLESAEGNQHTGCYFQNRKEFRVD